MRKRVAIVGSGPTALYALQDLIGCRQPLSVSIFEAANIAGKGTPYQRGINGSAMLSNIASVEIPALPQSLVSWLSEQSDAYLADSEIAREKISDRDFYPRVVIGDFFRAQFETIIHCASRAGHVIEVLENCQVLDITPIGDGFVLALSNSDSIENTVFDYAIVATGHSFPAHPETSRGFFEAPWPADALQPIRKGNIGVLGTSLSAIDAIVAVTMSFGEFRRDQTGVLNYHLGEGNDGLHVTMMSRKGLLPEADFYFPIPYEEPKICTEQAVEARIMLGSSGLLDDVYELFKQELMLADPAYAEEIGLDGLTIDTFSAAYYGVRDKQDPFEWAQSNLAEAKLNYHRQHTVAWRYAILITHEIVESAVGYFDTDDLMRFNKSFKGIFSDDYATVPHLSIERLLALHRSGHLGIVALGDQLEISRDDVNGGALVRSSLEPLQFDTFIDATGQSARSADDLPFPTLVELGLISAARTVTARGNQRRTGGIDVDDQCRPLIAGTQPVRRLYIPAISYLLHKRPFVQGITSAAKLGQTVAASVIAEVTRPQRSRRVRIQRNREKSTTLAA